jgi:hypothetical protein
MSGEARLTDGVLNNTIPLIPQRASPDCVRVLPPQST